MDDKEFLKKLGLKIKFARIIKGITQEDIMGALNIDKSYISKLERGLANPSIIYLKHITKFLGLELSDCIKIEE